MVFLYPSRSTVNGEFIYINIEVGKPQIHMNEFIKALAIHIVKNYKIKENICKRDIFCT